MFAQFFQTDDASSSLKTAILCNQEQITTPQSISDAIELTVILRGRVEYELIYITNEAVGRILLGLSALSAHIRQVREE